SRVPARGCIVSPGAIAGSPVEMQGWLSNTGRNDVPAFVVFQLPPAAPATKNVFEGLGIPTTLDTRPPMLAGPTLRQRKPASTVESSGGAGGACAAGALRAGPRRGRATTAARRCGDMGAAGLGVAACAGTRSRRATAAA